MEVSNNFEYMYKTPEGMSSKLSLIKIDSKVVLMDGSTIVESSSGNYISMESSVAKTMSKWYPVMSNSVVRHLSNSGNPKSMVFEIPDDIYAIGYEFPITGDNPPHYLVLAVTTNSAEYKEYFDAIHYLSESSSTTDHFSNGIHLVVSPENNIAMVAYIKSGWIDVISYSEGDDTLGELPSTFMSYSGKMIDRDKVFSSDMVMDARSYNFSSYGEYEESTLLSGTQLRYDTVYSLLKVYTNARRPNLGLLTDEFDKLSKVDESGEGIIPALYTILSSYENLEVDEDLVGIDYTITKYSRVYDFSSPSSRVTKYVRLINYYVIKSLMNKYKLDVKSNPSLYLNVVELIIRSTHWLNSSSVSITSLDDQSEVIKSSVLKVIDKY